MISNGFKGIQMAAASDLSDETKWECPLEPSEAIWGHLRSFEVIWGHLKSFEVIWSHLWSRPPVWRPLKPNDGAIWDDLGTRPRHLRRLRPQHFEAFGAIFTPFHSKLFDGHTWNEWFHLKIIQNLIQRSFEILRIIILEFSGVLSRCDLELSEVEKWAGILSPLTPQLSPSHPNPPGYYAFVKG